MLQGAARADPAVVRKQSSSCPVQPPPSTSPESVQPHSPCHLSPPFPLPTPPTNPYPPQLFITIGILVAQMINYGTQFYSWGWRLSLGLAAVPSLALTIGCLFVPDTPNSLVDRGYPAEARRALEKIRGVQSEFSPAAPQGVKGVVCVCGGGGVRWCGVGGGGGGGGWGGGGGGVRGEVARERWREWCEALPGVGSA
jgi:hypothetical protein